MHVCGRAADGTFRGKGWIHETVPRRDGVTFVNEELARFETEGRVGFGISEHWHAVPR